MIFGDDVNMGYFVTPKYLIMGIFRICQKDYLCSCSIYE